MLEISQTIDRFYKAAQVDDKPDSYRLRDLSTEVYEMILDLLSKTSWLASDILENIFLQLKELVSKLAIDADLVSQIEDRTLSYNHTDFNVGTSIEYKIAGMKELVKILETITHKLESKYFQGQIEILNGMFEELHEIYESVYTLGRNEENRQYGEEDEKAALRRKLEDEENEKRWAAEDAKKKSV